MCHAQPVIDLAILRLHLEVDPVISWAAEHCGVPLIRRLTVENCGDQPLGPLELTASLAPDFIDPTHIPLGILQPGETRDLERPDLRLPAGRLRTITELERAHWHLKASREDTVLAEFHQEVEVLPCSHYPGSRQPAGLLTAFVTPNHPVVAQLLKRTAARLRQAEGSAAITGYQERNPLKVKAQVAALLQVIQDLELSYTGLPASFEATGQKVRFPDVIVRDGLANCLDLTLLIAACLEQMDLRPLVVLIKGHAFPGVWLLEERFPEGQVFDAARLRTLCALDQVAVWDSSAILQQPPLSFQQLQDLGQRHLAADGIFEHALDVRVLRGERFLPLPLREALTASADEPAPAGPTRDELRELLEAAEREGAHPSAEVLVRPSEVTSRWQRWKDRLLDLSLRNRLLNFKPTGTGALALEVPDLACFEDLLADQNVMELLPRPPQDARDARDLKLLSLREDADAWKAQRLADLKARTVHSPLTAGEFWTRARDLDLKARTDLEEGGVSTLFAAIGLLRWYEPGLDTARYAPLLLYPVQLLFNRPLRRVNLQRLSEDPLPNTSLIEKLRRDLGVDLAFLGELEADASGLDMGQMLRRTREAIGRMPRWEVLDEVHLGHFTFAKFLMWKDLEDNAEVLLGNPLIHHLAMDDLGDLAQQPSAVTAEDLETLPPGQFPCVVDADATQLSAVASALAGRSFVLQGPPGTGKSQTIANLIACALARHLRVLFVSEKMAALEVVHSRLKQAGLEDFCMELHSHKANRRAVVESLQRALERGTRTTLSEWEAREADLTQHRDALNAYQRALHQPRPLGLTMWEALDQVHALRVHPEIQLQREDLENLGTEELRQARRALEDFAERAEALETARGEAWAGTNPGPWTHALQEDLKQALANTLMRVTEVIRHITDADDTLKVALPPFWEPMEALVAALGVMHELPPCAVDAEAWAPLAEALEAHRAAADRLCQREQGLGRHWRLELLDQDLTPLQAQYQQHALSFPVLRWFQLWGAASRLKPFARAGLPSPLEVLAALDEAMGIQRERARLATESVELTRHIAPAPWETAFQLPEKAALLRKAEAMLTQHGCAAPVIARFRECWPPERESIVPHLRRALENLRPEQERLYLLLGLPWDHPLPGPAAKGHLGRLFIQVEAWRAALPSLPTWCHYREAAEALERLRFQPIVEAHRNGVPPQALAPAGERALLERWIARMRDLDPALRTFDGTQHHRRISRFRELDRQWIQLSRAYVQQRLEARLPRSGAGVSENSEMGILLREIKKKARHLPTRKLLQAIPTLLPRLKPCLLMSPLSVAQYLPAENEPFDLLVFDEASQITTHDAIGALARGRQVVVVGDSRQLPPTSFFSRNLDEEETPDENDVTELESILDEAVAKQFPQALLGWHYRSRHHDLIDFSNRHYYDNRLHVFPAAAQKNPHLGLAWHPVPDGVYLSAGCEPRRLERTNPREAEVLVAHLADTLRRTVPGTRTFGVVTFSLSQQRLVQELLDEQRARFPELEAHFTGPEAVFVKNLENVQGDERDEILFSIGYARDAKGRLRMAFGPLSIAGGERRLNVAVTRARCQLRVFSTLTHDQIDLGRTTSRGAEHLRNFLQFVAERGTRELVAPPRTGLGALERDIAEVLEGLGHTVHAQVGCGGYRIDLAVVDPTRPGHYGLGIECDGPGYGSAPSARDRDRLRLQVLEGLGWRLHRIWSADWQTFREREIERLKAALEAPLPLPAPPSPAVPVEMRPFSMPPPDPLDEGYRTSAPPVQVAEAPPLPHEEHPGQPYAPLALAPVPGNDPEAFYLPTSADTTKRLVQQLLSEAPLHRDDLAGRIVRAWGWTALTRRGRTHMDQFLQKLERQGELRLRGDIVWRSDQNADTYDTFRIPQEGSPREAERIPPEEIASAMAAVLHANIALDEAALLRETARLLGYRRVTTRTTEALKAGLPTLELRLPGCTREGGYRWVQGR